MGRAGKCGLCSIKVENLHVAHRGPQQPHISHSPVTIYLITTPRNTSDLITRPLSALTEIREGQESHHPETEDKHSKLNGNLTGQE